MRSAREIIRRKRDGGELNEDEIRAFLSGVLDGSIPRYQASALLMAVYFRGMTGPELARFTAAMIDSGGCCAWRADCPRSTSTPREGWATR